MPQCAMATTTVVGWAERNLAMAHLLGVHVDLKDALRSRIGTHPNIPAAYGHATGVPRLGRHGLQHFSFPIHQPGVFGQVLRLRQVILGGRLPGFLLLANP
jgi:hypothetical protein